jgi:hypothetical protein
MLFAEALPAQVWLKKHTGQVSWITRRFLRV